MKTQLFLIYFLFLVGINYEIFAQDAATQALIRGNVDWIFGDAGDAPPPSLEAWTVPVPIGNGLYSIRGPLGAHRCGYSAILFAKANLRNEALQWLQVAQSHNGHVQNLFGSYPDYTLDYMLGNKDYVQRAFKHWGLAVANPSLSLVLQTISSFRSSHNPDHYPDHLRPKKDVYEKAHGGKPSSKQP